jgi:hypothetical protein
MVKYKPDFQAPRNVERLLQQGCDKCHSEVPKVTASSANQKPPVSNAEPSRDLPQMT